MKTMFIPYEIKTQLEVIFQYAKHVDRWNRVKNELLVYLHPSLRKLFSIRNKNTNRQTLNDMEKEIIELWISWGGKRLKLPQDYE